MFFYNFSGHVLEIKFIRKKNTDLFKINNNRLRVCSIKIRSRKPVFRDLWFDSVLEEIQADYCIFIRVLPILGSRVGISGKLQKFRKVRNVFRSLLCIGNCKETSSSSAWYEINSRFFPMFFSTIFRTVFLQNFSEWLLM